MLEALITAVYHHHTRNDDYTDNDIIEYAKENYLENLKTGHCFDFDAAALYALQLRIAERNARFRVDTGERNYAELYKTVIDQASKSGV